MDSFRLYMLHFYMFDHMLKMGLQQTAEAFAREAGISNAADGFNIHNSYLGEFWCDYWDSLDDSYGETRAESSTQGAARASAWAQIRAHAQFLAECRARVPTVDPRHASLHAQAQARASANDRILINGTYVYANTPSQPIVDSTGNGGQHGFQQGLGQEPSRRSTVRGSRPSRGRANGFRSQRGGANN